MNRKQFSTEIEQWVQQNAASSLALVSDLVQIYSVNQPPKGNELAAQTYLARYLEDAGADVRVYELSEVEGLREHPAYMSSRQYEGRPNVAGVFKGSGGGKSLLFSGHMDTVYEGTEAWTYPPFSGELHDGKLYGRGSYDMKGGLAAAVAAVKCIKELGIPLRGDVMIESVVDEEHGGANGTLAGRLLGPHADMAIIPEPTNLQIYPAHFGGGIWKATFTGISGIGFNGEELISALEATISFSQLLGDFRGHLRKLYPTPDWWVEAGRELEVMLLSILSGDTTRELQEKLPATGSLNFWIEGYPGMTGDEIMAELQRFYESSLSRYPLLAKCRPEIVPLIRFLQASEMPATPQVESFLQIVDKQGRKLLGDRLGPPRGAPFACDGFMFNLHSPTPALILGPSGANAHAADEYLDTDSFHTLVTWYAEIIVDWCGISGETEEENNV